jgi:hypothetical protein
MNLWLELCHLLSEASRYRCNRTLETPGIASQKNFSITGIWCRQVVQVISKFNSGTSEACSSSNPQQESQALLTMQKQTLKTHLPIFIS